MCRVLFPVDSRQSRQSPHVSTGAVLICDEVAALAASNFHHRRGIKKDDFLKENMGGIDLVNFSGDEHSPEVDDCWAIVTYRTCCSSPG